MARVEGSDSSAGETKGDDDAWGRSSGVGRTSGLVDAVMVAVGTSSGNSGLNTGVVEATGFSGLFCLSATENLMVARTGSDPSGMSPWKLPQ